MPAPRPFPFSSRSWEFFDGQELGAFEDSLVVLVAAIAHNERHGAMKIYCISANIDYSNIEIG